MLRNVCSTRTGWCSWVCCFQTKESVLQLNCGKKRFATFWAIRLLNTGCLLNMGCSSDLHAPTIYSLHSTFYTLHSTLYTLHSTLYILHSTLYTQHFTLQTLHSTLYTLHSTLYTQHFTLYTLHSWLHILHFTLYSNQLALRIKNLKIFELLSLVRLFPW